MPRLKVSKAKRIRLAIIFLLIFKAGICYAEQGTASWYSEDDTIEVRNKYTAYNEKFSDKAMTCASLKYPHNTLLRVTNLRNNKSVIVRVNDKGPAKRLGRIIDLTKSAFEDIEFLSAGLCQVDVEVMK